MKDQAWKQSVKERDNKTATGKVNLSGARKGEGDFQFAVNDLTTG